VRSSTLIASRHGFTTSLACLLALFGGVLAWLWPIGIGGKMPVGGDVTQFFLGLMGFLSDSLHAGRLPIWNDLWGYGFPGLAESQMGVFYPVHILVYRWFNTETAYVISLMIHTLWGSLGAFWAARRVGISAPGSALAAFAWSTCGFFMVHLAHPWGYTTGCWMPWAFGLAWCILAPGGKPRRFAPFWLSLVLVLQVLPGHFQLAFLTQAVIVLMIAWAAVEDWGGRLCGRRAAEGVGLGLKMSGAGGIVLALASVFPLAALQLWPTARLAELAAGQRDFEYLSGFASTPFHLVNYVAPGLFHRSTLWRPLVWDPFHTSPEEHLAYVGLVPLFLACATMIREWRRDPAVRMLTAVAIVTLVLSLGPYAPGFRYLITVPGFSFFRAPSRWSLATALGLALLAGKGFDRWQAWPRPERAARWFGVGALVWILATVGLLELALRCTSSSPWPFAARGFERAFHAMPWQRDPGFPAVMAHARQAVADRRFPVGFPQPIMVFVNERWKIYGTELWEPAALLGALWLVAWAVTRGRLKITGAKRGLALIVFVDLCALGHHRLIDVGPLARLETQSPVLARLAQEPRGARIADDRFRNLPMLVGLAPISAYRTLNLPAAEELSALATGPWSGPVFEPLFRGAVRATGAGVRVLDPIENRKDHILRAKEQHGELIDDPELAAWLFGREWVAAQGGWARTFLIWRPQAPPTRAWLVPLDELPDSGVLDDWSSDPRDILAVFDRAQPLFSESSEPEEWSITVTVDEPAVVIVSQLADPAWTARWIGHDDQGESDTQIIPTFRKRGEPGGWQRVFVPGRGCWTLRLEYDASDLVDGLAITTVAWASWILAALVTGLRAVVRPFQAERDQSGA
jgi:hypothetical protein